MKARGGGGRRLSCVDTYLIFICLFQLPSQADVLPYMPDHKLLSFSRKEMLHTEPARAPHARGCVGGLFLSKTNKPTKHAFHVCQSQTVTRGKQSHGRAR